MARRVLDLIVASVGIVLLAPLLVSVAVTVRLFDGGPIWFTARRVGRLGREFNIIKFRTMLVGAVMCGPGVTARDDGRITRLGRFLRKTKIDELPQLFNIVRGDMSLTGPRPEDPRYVALFTSAQRELLTVRPGMASAASLAYRHEEKQLTGQDRERVYIEEVLPDKLAMDLAYIRSRTFFSDLCLIVRTIRCMWSGPA